MKRINKNRNFRIAGFAIAILVLFTGLFAIGAGSYDASSMEISGLESAVMSATFVAPVFMIKSMVKDKDGNDTEVLTFKELSEEDLKEFQEKGESQDLAAYFIAKNEHARAELQKLVDEKATAEDIKEATDAIREDMAEQAKALNESLKQFGLAIKKLSKKEKVELEKGQFASVRDGLMEHKETLEAMSEDEKDSKSLRISFKAVGDMTIAGNVSGGNVPVEQRLAGLDVIASRRLRLMDVVSSLPALSNTISWVSQSGKEGSAGGTTEGALKNQIDFNLVVDSEAVKKRTAFIKVSTEMLGDIDFMASEINNELMRELGKDVEAQVYEGDDAGNNLNGIRTVASAFAAGTFAGDVDNANVVDVLRVAMNQIAIAEQEMPNAILMHPSDLTTLLLTKVTSSDKRYIEALQEIASNRSLDGVPIITTTLVTVDEYLIGDFTMATVWNRGDISIEVGLDGNDFTKNIRTVLAEWRGLVIVKTNRRSAFVAGTFSTDAAVLETA